MRAISRGERRRAGKFFSVSGVWDAVGRAQPSAE
jgi:hypothetical protein